jgi:hypothetical protein
MNQIFKILLAVLTLTLSVSACDTGPLASADSIREKATQSLQQKNFSDAAKMAEELTRKVPDGYDGYFLLAQARAQLDDKNAALAALEAAIKKGYKDDKAIEENANLKPIRSMTAYAELMDISFPKRDKKVEMNTETSTSASVGIIQSDTKTVIRAGDVVVEMPKDR